MPLGTPFLVGQLANGTGATTVILAGITAVPAGYSVIVAASTNNASDVPAAVADSKSNTWTASAAEAAQRPVTLFTSVLTSALTSGDSITVTFGSTTVAHSAIAIACSGTVATAAVDVTGSNAATGTTAVSVTGTAAPSWEPELCVAAAAFGNAGASISWDAAWTALPSSPVHTGASQYTSLAWQVTAGAPPALTATATLGANAQYGAVLISLKSADGGPAVFQGGYVTASAAGGPPPAHGTPYLLASAAPPVGWSNPQAVTFIPAQQVMRGDCIGVVVGLPSIGGGTTRVQSVADTAGNSYALVDSAAPGLIATYWQALNALPLDPAADTITVTFTIGSQHWGNIIAFGCSGVAPSSATDIAASASGSSTSPALTSATLAQPNELAVAIITNATLGGDPSWAGGWTPLAGIQQPNTPGAAQQWTSLAWQATSSTGALTPAATLAGSSPAWVLLLVTLQLASTAPAAIVTAPVTIGTSASVGPAYGSGDAAAVTLCLEAAGFPAFSGAVTAHIDVAARAKQAYTLVNKWILVSGPTYGLLNVPVANLAGDALIAYVGWNAAEVNPVAGIADDAHNWWIPLAVSAATGDVRCAAWIAPNAAAATNISVGLSWFAQSAAVVIAEISGIPDWAAADITVTAHGNAATTLALSGTATGSDIAFGVKVSGNNTIATTRSSGWNTIATLTQNDPGGAGGPADLSLNAVWTTAPPGPLALTYTAGTVLPLAGVMVAITANPAAPAQKNPAWPALKVEAAFGAAPGSPQHLPAWTDITARLMSQQGQPQITASRGHQYELEAPEAGNLTIQLNNDDGALTPGNSASPYSPDVLLGTPVRVSAAWNGRWYAVAAGYAERWPQTWPDPQWGQVPLEAPDALDALSNSVLPSAILGEILLDAPYAVWPCSDTYVQDGAGGLPLANAARTNQRPMTCTNAPFLNADGSTGARFLQTGQSWFTITVGQVAEFEGLAGDPASTGIGVTADTAGDTISPQAGAFYTAPDMPQPSAGLTVAFWVTVDPTLTDESHFMELLRLSGPASNFYASSAGVAFAFNRGARLLVRCNPRVLSLDLMDYNGDDYNVQFATHISDGNPHHIAVTVQAAGGNYQYAVYLDGASLTPGGGTSSGVTPASDWNYLGIGGVIHSDGGIAYSYNYTIGYVALFGVVLPASRIRAQYGTAVNGSSGDDSVTRWAKLLTWGGFGLQRAAAPPSPSPTLGPADQIAGNSVADAGATLATTDGGLLYADAAGNITWWPRAFMFNRPVKWVFGDNPGNGEIPYDPGEAYDYDNSFLYNLVTAQRQVNSFENAALATAADIASQQQYFTRTALAETIETGSDEDAYDMAAWLLASYKQPELRVQQVVLNPAADPAVWPAALGTEQGDIVRLIRRPLGGAPISILCIVQMISHSIGPDTWTTTISMVPYALASAVLQCDVPGYENVGQANLGW